MNVKGDLFWKGRELVRRTKDRSRRFHHYATVKKTSQADFIRETDEGLTNARSRETLLRKHNLGCSRANRIPRMSSIFIDT